MIIVPCSRPLSFGYCEQFGRVGGNRHDDARPVVPAAGNFHTVGLCRSQRGLLGFETDCADTKFQWSTRGNTGAGSRCTGRR